MKHFWYLVDCRYRFGIKNKACQDRCTIRCVIVLSDTHILGPLPVQNLGAYHSVCSTPCSAFSSPFRANNPCMHTDLTYCRNLCIH